MPITVWRAVAVILGALTANPAGAPLHHNAGDLTQWEPTLALTVALVNRSVRLSERLPEPARAALQRDLYGRLGPRGDLELQAVGNGPEAERRRETIRNLRRRAGIAP